MTDELLIQVLSELKVVRGGIQELQSTQTEMREELTAVRGSVAVIENDHGAQLGALWDGQQALVQSVDLLDRKIDRVERTLGLRIDRVEQKVGDVERTLGLRISDVERKVDDLRGEVGEVARAVGVHEAKLSAL